MRSNIEPYILSFGRRIVVGFCTLLCSFLFAATQTHAQTAESFSGFLRALPQAAEVSTESALIASDVDSLDASKDIRLLEEHLRRHIDAMEGNPMQYPAPVKNPGAAVSSQTARTKQGSVPQSAETRYNSQSPVVRNRVQSVPSSGTALSAPLDSLIVLTRAIQAVESEYKNYFDAVENTYNYRVNVANELSRKQQSQHPCNDDPACELQHRKDRDRNLFTAEKLRVNLDAELLRHEIAELLPVLSELDAALPASLASMPHDNTRQTLTDITNKALYTVIAVSEHLKLNRIHVWQCAKLLHEIDS